MIGRRVDGVVVGLLCAAVFAQAWSSLRVKSMTFDELTYIPAGYSYVTTGDYRLNPEHPPLSKLLAGAALLSTGIEIDTEDESWRTAEQWGFGNRFFDSVGARTHEIVSRARLPTVVLTMLLVVASYLLGSALYGRHAGLLAAFLCAFSPNLLAHGRLATNDLAQACLIVWCGYSSLVFARRPGVGSGALLGAVLGLALLTKYSAVLLLGLVPAWVVAAAWVERGRGGREGAPATDGEGPWSARRFTRQAAAPAVLALVVCLAIVSAGYRSPTGVVDFVRNLGVLYTNVHTELPTYFAGRFHEGGLPYYFVAAFLLKTSLAALALIAVRAADQVTRRDPDPLGAAFLLVPALIWLVVMTASALQFGVRYILPVYPLLFVYAAGIVASPRLAAGWRRAAIGVLALLFAASSLRAHPHYIPFFNAAAGGPEGGIHWLDDSNVDWGQDLVLLGEYLEERGIRDATVVPMALYDPALYDVPGRWRFAQDVLPLLVRPDPPPGVYAVSSHLLTRARWGGAQPVVDPLTDLEPVAVIGHSMRVFEIPPR